MIDRSLLVCLLGGSGFIGTEIAARLARGGHRVRIVTRKFATAAHLRVLPSCEIVVGDVHAVGSLERCFDGADVVINLIGILNERGRSGAGFRRVHAELARRVVDAAVARRVSRLLQMSSLGADIHGPSHYLRSKGEAERAVRAAPAILETTIFRPSVVFGARDSLTNRFAGLLRLSGGLLPLAKPDARFAPVYVGDVAEAFIRSLHGGPTSGRTYELCGPDVVTLEQLVRMIAAAADLPCHLIRLPDFVARMQAFVMDFLPGKPFSTDNYRSLSQDSICRENGCAQLGIAPTSLAAILPTYLGNAARETRLDSARSRVGRPPSR